jgi:SH3-like domain-containing protein
MRRAVLALALAAGPAGAAAAQEQLHAASLKPFEAEAGTPPRVSDFSGLPVPRYASLRHDEVNGRSGPGLEYPVAWSYVRQGLPVVVVRESQDWRKIRDPQGDEVWVHRRMLAAERTVLATVDGAILRQPGGRSGVVARFSPGAVMNLETCVDGWCRVEAEGFHGWALEAQLWGAEELADDAGAAPAR